MRSQVYCNILLQKQIKYLGILDKYVADHFPPNIEISKQHGVLNEYIKIKTSQ